jgi:Kdo2-lipid IVA lauroyltransferase/acyltransferase
MVALYALRFVVFLFAWLPFWVLYRLADFFYFVLFYLIRYRYKVIEDNLRHSFPEKNEKELRLIIKGVYRNLSDLAVEGIKGLSMSKKALQRRYKFINPEITNALKEANRSGILSGGHFTNWEWGVLSWNIWLAPQSVGIYMPVRNKYVESYLNQKRGQWGLVLAPTYETRQAIECNAHQSCLFVLLGDQSPNNTRKVHWVDFLTQRTAWNHGIDTLARTYDFPVYFMDVRRVRRGYYEIEVLPLCLSPKSLEAGEITKLYVAAVEKSVQRKPEDWLWSHKRWKLGRDNHPLSSNN